MNDPLSQLRVLDYLQTRDVKSVYDETGTRILRLEPGPTRQSIKVGTTADDAVTLNLAAADYDALMSLAERVVAG